MSAMLWSDRQVYEAMYKRRRSLVIVILRKLVKEAKKIRVTYQLWRISVRKIQGIPI